MAKAAQVAEETYAQANGAYTTSTAALEAIDPSLADTSAAALGTPSGVTFSGFTVSAAAAVTDRTSGRGSRRHRRRGGHRFAGRCGAIGRS